jgi:hypothetical protein
MVRKKSAASKTKSRRDAYRRRMTVVRNSRPWRILLLVMHAVRICLRSRNNAAIAARLPRSWDVQDDEFIPRNSAGVLYDDVSIIFPDLTGGRGQFDNFAVVRQVMCKMLSRVSRLDMEQERQAKRRINLLPKEKKSESRRICQQNWLTNKYRNNETFRTKKVLKVVSNVLEKYHNIEKFRVSHKKRAFKRYHSNDQVRSKVIQQALERYRRQCSSIERQ